MAAQGNGRRIIDLDARRKARAEVQREPVTLVMGGVKFTLPPEMPADFALYAQEDGRLRDAISALIGEQAEEFFALRPSMDDITDLVNAAAEVYGVAPGEAQASAAS